MAHRRCPPGWAPIYALTADEFNALDIDVALHDPKASESASVVFGAGVVGYDDRGAYAEQTIEGALHDLREAVDARRECHHCGAPSPGDRCRYCGTVHVVEDQQRGRCSVCCARIRLKSYQDIRRFAVTTIVHICQCPRAKVYEVNGLASGPRFSNEVDRT